MLHQNRAEDQDGGAVTGKMRGLKVSKIEADRWDNPVGSDQE